MKKKKFRQLLTNFCRLFRILAQLPFTTSELELDYYHQKVNVQVATQSAERLQS